MTIQKDIMKNSFSRFVKTIGENMASAADAAVDAAGASLVAVKDSASKTSQTVIQLGKNAGEAIVDAAAATSDFASQTGDAVAENASKSLVVVKQGASSLGDSASAGVKSAKTAIGTMADSAGNAISAVGLLVGDLNGDGKVDFEDAKIAAAKAKELGSAAATELGHLGKKALQSDLVKDTAAGALVGGALATMVPIPFVTTVAGATVGGALAAYKSLGKK